MSGGGEAGSPHHVDVLVSRPGWEGRVERSGEAACVTVHRVGDTIGRGQRRSVAQQRSAAVYWLPVNSLPGGEVVGGGGGGGVNHLHLYDGRRRSAVLLQPAASEEV